ncbi:MAG: DUF3579 domain-containing protein [Thiohalorhabdus sp.]|uniref:DUF3579 domain-containing protein n=1 Tax=Thiohalorhabdus sp. TaxID=3094134 RepID=UPI00397EDBBA
MTEHEGNDVARTQDDPCMIIVEGVTQSGGKFRPSDWVERFAGNAATFGDDNRLHYSPYIKPTVYKGVKGLLVDPALREERPELFQQLVGFARANRLRIPRTCGVSELQELVEELEGEEQG